MVALWHVRPASLQSTVSASRKHFATCKGLAQCCYCGMIKVMMTVAVNSELLLPFNGPPLQDKGTRPGPNRMPASLPLPSPVRRPHTPPAPRHSQLLHLCTQRPSNSLFPLSEMLSTFCLPGNSHLILEGPVPALSEASAQAVFTVLSHPSPHST